MRCPKCGEFETKVIDSRQTDDGYKIRRRRECNACGYRFTTYEKLEEVEQVVIKRNGERQIYNRDKIINSIIRACDKRTIPLDKIEQIAENIERKLMNSFQSEISTEQIGELVMDELKNVDDVAYVRFASVYRKFKDVNSFMDELRKIIDERDSI